MYSVILIDDEYITCKTFSQFINWEKCGFYLKNTFTDSRLALDYLRNNNVDLVITDINMPFVSGIDVAKYIYENNLECIVIFLSAYDEIQYAKLGMKYNVKRYLNKPISKKKLINDLEEIKTILFHNTVHSETFNFYLFSEYFRGIAIGNKIEDKNIISNFDFYNCHFCIFDLCIENIETDEKMLKGFYNIFRFIYPDFNFCVLETYPTFYKILIFSNDKICEDWNLEYQKEIVNNLKINIRIENVNFFSKAEEISKYYNINNKSIDDSKIKNAIIANVEKFIDENIQKPLTVKFIASNVFVSEDYLSKLFKKYTDRNISDYIIEKKIEYAKHLLSNTDIKISRIMEEIGYSSSTYFYAMFKKHTGKTPNEFRKNEE